MRPDGAALVQKWESEMEEPHYCQLCGRSPGSLASLGRSLCNRAAAAWSSPKQFYSELVQHPLSAPPCFQLGVCVHQSCESRLPTTPSTQRADIERPILIRVLPCVWGFVADILHHATPLHCPGPHPRSSWLRSNVLTVPVRVSARQPWRQSSQCVVGSGICAVEQDLPRTLQIQDRFQSRRSSANRLFCHKLGGSQGRAQHFDSV